MSIGNKSFVAAYICLVGIPILGLIGILNAGHDLHAPPAIGGVWDMQADLQPMASALCATSPASSPQGVLNISQSGKYLTLAVDHLQGWGTIENTTVTAGELRLASGVSCEAREVSVYFQARIEPSSRPGAAMNGVLRVNGCASCAAVPFRAVRRPETKTGR